MGRKHRLTRYTLALLACTELVACSGKEQEEAEQRKALLEPQDLSAKRAAAYEAARLHDDQGRLLPSTTKIAGLLLPRGLKPLYIEEYEWEYEGDVNLARLEEYLREHLVVHAVHHPNKHRTDFTRATPKDTPGAADIAVSFSRKSGQLDVSTLRIRATRPPPAYRPSQEEVQAQMKARAEHAD